MLSTFGFDLPAGNVVLTPRTVILSLAVGIVTTVVAAASPARKAGRVAPIAALRDVDVGSTGYGSRLRVIVGCGVLGLGAASLLLGLFAEPSAAGVGPAAAKAAVEQVANTYPDAEVLDPAGFAADQTKGVDQLLGVIYASVRALRSVALLAFAGSAVMLVGCGSQSEMDGWASALDDQAITVASFDFPESELLAEIYGRGAHRFPSARSGVASANVSGAPHAPSQRRHRARKSATKVGTKSSPIEATASTTQEMRNRQQSLHVRTPVGDPLGPIDLERRRKDLTDALIPLLRFDETKPAGRYPGTPAGGPTPHV
jgi:hypothetical protein